LDASQPWKINVAEDMQNNSWITRKTALGGAGFDSQWSNFVHTVRDALISPNDNDRNMFSVRDAIQESFNGNPFERVIYTESHDENANGKRRVPSEIDPNNPSSYWAQKRSTLGAAITLTSPGIPMLFQGQEILEDGWFSDTDPVDWSKLNTFAGIHLLYKDLIKLRRNLTGRTNGLRGPNLNVHHVNNSNKVIAYHRWMNGGANDDVVVAANFRNATYSNYRIGLPRSGGWTVVFNSDWNGYSPLFGNTFSPNITADAQPWDGMNFSGIVNLAPYSVVILAKD
jgi:1,4-alpha-glucan branching enzyme